MFSGTCTQHSFLKFVLKDASYGFQLSLIFHKSALYYLFQSLKRCLFLFTFSELFQIFFIFRFIYQLTLFLLFVQCMKLIFLSFEAKIILVERKFEKCLVCLKLTYFQFFLLMIKVRNDGVIKSYLHDRESFLSPHHLVSDLSQEIQADHFYFHLIMKYDFQIEFVKVLDYSSAHQFYQKTIHQLPQQNLAYLKNLKISFSF